MADPLGQYVPFKQGRQVDEFAGEYVPAGHCVGRTPYGHRYPAAQGVGPLPERLLPPLADIDPTGQLAGFGHVKQLNAPTVSEYVPASHGIQ